MPPDVKQLLDRISFLEESRRYIQNALHLALSLGDFQEILNKRQDPPALLREAEKRIRFLIPFEGCLLYHVDQETSDFILSLAKPRELRAYMTDETENMIEKGFFSWALRERRGVFIASSDHSRRFLLHVISTHSRIRGMFIGLLSTHDANIPDASLALLSIILLNTANAMESLEFYAMMNNQNSVLEQKVEERTRALALSENRYRNLIENIPHMITVKNASDLHLVMVNRAGEELLGYSREELIGKTSLDIYPKEIAREIFAAEKRAIETSQVLTVAKESIRTRHHETRYISTRKIPLSGDQGKAQFLLEISEDITERCRAEDALHASEEKYRTIVEGIEEGYFEADLDGNLRFLNGPLSRICGYPREKLLGMNLREFSTPESEAKIRKIFARVRRTGKPQIFLEEEVIRNDGESLSIEMLVSLIRNAEGEAAGYRGLVRDVTERAAAERERKKLEARLLQAKNMETIGTLASGVAHDLNNVLSGLVSYPDLLLMKIPPGDPLAKPIRTIQKSGEKAAAIVQDLLTLARRSVAQRQVVNLNDIVTEYLESPEHERLRRFHPGMDLETRLMPGLRDILGSPVHLSKVIMNIVSNAAEAMPEGGKVILSTESRYLDHGVAGCRELKEGSYVILTVFDSGIGISEEDLGKIFEPFHTKKVMGRSGTGLGMAVVWATVKDHGGHIDVRSTVNEGTVFTLYFPATRRPRSVRPALTSVGELMGKGETILVVDDMPEQRQIASEILQRLGYSVHALASGEEAVEYLKSHRADLIILDMIMHPGIDGLETYRRIQQIQPGQAAIIASGYSESARVREARRIGATMYVKKPYLLETIGTAIRIGLRSK